MSEKGYMVRIKLVTRFVISATVPAHWGKNSEDYEEFIKLDLRQVHLIAEGCWHLFFLFNC